MSFSGQLRNPNDLTSEWFLKASGSGSRVGVVLPSKCLNYVNGLDLVENLGRKQSSSKGGRLMKNTDMAQGQREVEIINIIFLRLLLLLESCV